MSSGGRKTSMSALFVALIGGMLPAVFWGVTAVLQKQSAVHGTGPAYYLAAFGLVIALAGFVASQVWRDASWTSQGVGYAAMAGLTFSLGTGLISFALWRYQAPLSKLAPIWSCNVLVTVAISALLLGEASQLNLMRLGFGTIFIVVGAFLVTYA
jgi:uncharacterized membrane protein